MVMSVYTVLNDLIHFRQRRSMAIHGDDVMDLDMMAILVVLTVLPPNALSYLKVQLMGDVSATKPPSLYVGFGDTAY